MSGLAIAGLVVSAGTTAMSFKQANDQKDAQGRAEKKANEMLEEAKKRLDVNVYEALAIKKEPYELQREALLTQGASALQAGVEGDQRGAAATAGRVQLAQQQAQGDVRTAMGMEMQDLDKLVASEDSRLLDVGMQVGLEESAGARQAARDASNARQQAIMSGVQGIAGIGETAISQAELYRQKKTTTPLAPPSESFIGPPTETDWAKQFDTNKQIIPYNAGPLTDAQYNIQNNTLDPFNIMRSWERQRAARDAAFYSYR